jgi:hypothetical protein
MFQCDIKSYQYKSTNYEVYVQQNISYGVYVIYIHLWALPHLVLKLINEHLY